MYSNNIVNFQEFTAILNAHTKKVWKLIECTTYLLIIFSGGSFERTMILTKKKFVIHETWMFIRKVVLEYIAVPFLIKVNKTNEILSVYSMNLLSWFLILLKHFLHYNNET